jgi:hypothetical protein
MGYRNRTAKSDLDLVTNSERTTSSKFVVLAAIAAVAAILMCMREFCEESNVGGKATYVNLVLKYGRKKKMRTLNMMSTMLRHSRKRT